MTNFQRALVLEYLKQNSRKAALEILYDCAKTISQEQSSPLKATMGYNGEGEELILHFADQNITLSKEHHGNTALYRATSGNQALNIDELRRLCCLLHEISRRSGSESRESQERADTERNRVETGETEASEDKRRVVLTLVRDSFEHPEQREKLILFLQNNNLIQGLLLDIQDEQTHSNECADSLCSILEQKGILYHDSQSQQYAIDMNQWDTFLQNQLDTAYSPKSVRRNRRHNEEE